MTHVPCPHGPAAPWGAACSTVRRDATDAEKERLRSLLALSTFPRQWAEYLENALVIWAASSFGLVAIWLVAAWLGRKAFSIEFGLRSPSAIWILATVMLPAAALAVHSSLGLHKLRTRQRLLSMADLESGQVIEERMFFSEARGCEEPEHRRVVWFLRTRDEKVFVHFDLESLWAEEGDDGERKRVGNLTPSSSLVIVRAPVTRLVIGKVFSGEPLNLGAPIALDLPPAQWPEADEYCDIPWTDLDKRLGSRSA